MHAGILLIRLQRTRRRKKDVPTPKVEGEFVTASFIISRTVTPTSSNSDWVWYEGLKPNLNLWFYGFCILLYQLSKVDFLAWWNNQQIWWCLTVPWRFTNLDSSYLSSPQHILEELPIIKTINLTFVFPLSLCQQRKISVILKGLIAFKQQGDVQIQLIVTTVNISNLTRMTIFCSWLLTLGDGNRTQILL